MTGVPWTVERVGPILTPESHPVAGTNINGPSLVRVPDWVDDPLGRLYLYFADHKGDSIRLAHAPEVSGPYTWVDGGALTLADSRFPTDTPQGIEVTSDIQRAAIEAEGYDAHFTPHIASPDVVVDHANRRLVMAYHGLCEDGSQLTRIAESSDGLRWTAHEPLVAFPYLRIVPAPMPDGSWLAMSMPGIVYRSTDLLAWEAGPFLFDGNFRHCAVAASGSTLHVLWTRVGDEPEHILHTPIAMVGDWTTWAPGETSSVLRPQMVWEGADLPIEPSARGQVTRPVHQLRDPAVFDDDGATWLLYCVAGERGIALARLHER